MNWTLVLLLVSIVLLVLLILLLKKLSEYKDDNEALKDMIEFKNSSVKHDYGKLANYLESIKSKLSVQKKVEILNMWNLLLLKLQKGHSTAVDIPTEVINLSDDVLTAAQHKKYVIDALRELQQQETIDLDTLTTVTHHLYYMILK